MSSLAPALQDASIEQPATPARTGYDPESVGDLRMYRRQYLDAIQSYLEVPNRTASIWTKLGLANQHMFNMDAAKSDYQRALQINPHYPDALNNLGTIWYAEKNYRKSIQYYRKALKLASHSATIYINLGTAYFAKGEYTHGAEAYQSALRIDPDLLERDANNAIPEDSPREARAMMHYHMAKTCALAGKNDRAMLYIRQAIGEGFRDRKSLLEDKDLASLREMPEFQRLLSEEGLR